jgi:hypothetical protein
MSAYFLSIALKSSPAKFVPHSKFVPFKRQKFEKHLIHITLSKTSDRTGQYEKKESFAVPLQTQWLEGCVCVLLLSSEA